ncbi:MAG: hypothetical protein J6V19_06435 [Alistipes sp.]|nr:hypothetical protein [Alistipes sp.]
MFTCFLGENHDEHPCWEVVNHRAHDCPLQVLVVGSRVALDHPPTSSARWK